MEHLNIQQKESLMDILDALAIRRPIDREILSDEAVVQAYLETAQAVPEMAYVFLKHVPMDFLVAWTKKDRVKESYLTPL